MKQTGSKNLKSKWKSILSPGVIGMMTFVGIVAALLGLKMYSSDNWEIKAKKGIIESKTAQSAPLKTKGELITEDLPAQTKDLYGLSERIEQQTSIGISMTLTLLHETLKHNRQPTDVTTLIQTAKSRGLWQNYWKDGRDYIITPNTIHYLRYRPQPVSLEVLSASLGGDLQMSLLRIPEIDGAPIVIRDGESSRTQAGAVIVISPQTNAELPRPFTNVTYYEKAGWKRIPFKFNKITPEGNQELNNWIQTEAIKYTDIFKDR